MRAHANPHIPPEATPIRHGDRVQLELPFSEVCMHLRVAGQVMTIELIRAWYPDGRPNYVAQLHDDAGRPFSFPILTAEAGIYGYGDHMFCYPVPAASAGLVMSEPTPGQRGVLIARLTAAPVVHTTPGGRRVVTLRVTVRDAEEYVLTAFDRVVQDIDALTVGRLIYAEGRWQARQGAGPELILDVLSPFAQHLSTS